jgi:zinc protease
MPPKNRKTNTQFRILHRTFSNGLNAYVVPLPHARTVSVQLAVHAGSMHESVGLEGVAHLLEHLVFLGTDEHKSSESLLRAIGQYGGDLTAATGKEYTVYTADVPLEKTERAIEILAALFYRPTLPKRGLLEEKRVIKDEMQLDHDTLAWRASDALDGVMFANSSLSHPVIGTPKSVGKISLSDVKQFKKEWYTPRNSIVVVAGNLGEETLTAVSKYFSTTPLKKKGPTFDMKISPRAHYLSGKRFHYDVIAERDRTLVALAYPLGALTDVPDSELVLAEIILGRSSYSRLDQALRLNQGIAYDFGCSRCTYKTAGYLDVSVEVSPSRVNKALTVTLKTMEDFCLKGVTRDELTEAQTPGT